MLRIYPRSLLISICISQLDIAAAVTVAPAEMGRIFCQSGLSGEGDSKRFLRFFPNSHCHNAACPICLAGFVSPLSLSSILHLLQLWLPLRQLPNTTLHPWNIVNASTVSALLGFLGRPMRLYPRVTLALDEADRGRTKYIQYWRRWPPFHVRLADPAVRALISCW